MFTVDLENQIYPSQTKQNLWPELKSIDPRSILTQMLFISPIFL